MKSLKEVVSGIDWALLREQKEYCVNEACNNSECSEIYEGIVGLFDAIQDAAIADGLATETEVFAEREVQDD
jgi:hypothetical protein